MGRTFNKKGLKAIEKRTYNKPVKKVVEKETPKETVKDKPKKFDLSKKKDKEKF